MTQEPQELARNPWGVIRHHQQWRAVELEWLPATREMDDEGFKETLQLLAAEGERIKPATMIIDGNEFHHQLGEGVMEWRREHIIPRYNKAGVTRFAFLVPEGASGTVEGGSAPAPEDGANFPTGWFTSRQRAYEWLAE